MIYLGWFKFTGIVALLPVFLVVPRYMLWPEKFYFSYLAFVGVSMIYLCLCGTWVPVVAKKGLFELA